MARIARHVWPDIVSYSWKLRPDGSEFSELTIAEENMKMLKEWLQQSHRGQGSMEQRWRTP